MELFAVFETWHLADGNYPALKKGQWVNLSFELEPDELTVAENPASPEFKQLGSAEYRVTGSVLRVYQNADPSDRIVVVEANHFRFYISSSAAPPLQRGNVVSGRGTLVLDHYIWVEFLSRYLDPPDLFYTLQVTDICRFRTPERFIVRSVSSVSGTARILSDEDDPDDVTHVDVISDEDWTHYVMQLSDAGVPAGPIPRTFLS